MLSKQFELIGVLDFPSSIGAIPTVEPKPEDEFAGRRRES
jgi:hypothetical protein